MGYFVGFGVWMGKVGNWVVSNTIRLFSGGSFGFLGLFNLFLAHTNVFYGRTIGADQKEHTLSD